MTLELLTAFAAGWCAAMAIMVLALIEYRPGRYPRPKQGPWTVIEQKRRSWGGK